MIEGKFQIIVLGCSGGPRENDVSAYLVSTLKGDQWITLDAGTLLSGLEIAARKNEIPLTSLEMFKKIQAYLISHAHLDHIAALIINSPIDRPKPILGSDRTIDNIRDHLFNDKIWANYGDEGVNPLSLYHYMRLPLHKEVAIPNTSFTIEAFDLNHGRSVSSAFLIGYEGHYLLYLGDTASDETENVKRLTLLWKRTAEILKKGRLHALFLECSFPYEDKRPNLFGHLDTKLMMIELHRLAELSKSSLEGLKVIVTHRKENLSPVLDDRERIAEELTSFNDLSLQFIFPSQGEKLIV